MLHATFGIAVEPFISNFYPVSFTPLTYSFNFFPLRCLYCINSRTWLHGDDDSTIDNVEHFIWISCHSDFKIFFRNINQVTRQE